MMETRAIEARDFKPHDLPEKGVIWVGSLPTELRFDRHQFEVLWSMHPEECHEIMMHGRLVRTPRWQQAYGMDYHYTGRVNKALPVPPLLQPTLAWARETIHEGLNGILLNWYDGALGHYIGPHRDSIANMVKSSPIVTISHGGGRIFRLRVWPKSNSVKPVDLRAEDGAVFIMPWETNERFTHEIPRAKRCTGRRVSIAIRAFRGS